MIGMDIGTTHSKAAIVDPTGKPSLILSNRGDPTTPSVLYYQNGSPPLIGVDAKEQGVLDPPHCVQNFKLCLGTTDNLLPDGRLITPTDATADLIGQLKQDIEKNLGMEITQLCATCPANSRDDFKQALIEAFGRNHIKVLKLIPEPTAAGSAYAIVKQGTNMKYGVYDFGGGTFDATIMNVEMNSISILATQGVPKLGGNDINDIMFELAMFQIENKFHEKPTIQSDPLLVHDLASRIESVKLSLGNRQEVPLVVNYKGEQLIVKYTQEWYHKAIDPLIDQSLKAFDQAIAAAGLTVKNLHCVVLVGGTCRIPYVQKRISEHTGLPLKMEIDPQRAVVYGAALASVSEMSQLGQTATIRGQVIPAPEMFCRDVTAHAVGCCVMDKTGPASRMVNAVAISKNTPIPCQKTALYYLEHEDQTEARIEILQGEPDADRDQCLVIGELALKELPQETQRSQRIQVVFTIDVNGMVTVTATDKVSSKTQTIAVDYKKGIQPKEKPKSI